MLNNLLLEAIVVDYPLLWSSLPWNSKIFFLPGIRYLIVFCVRNRKNCEYEHKKHNILKEILVGS